MFNLKVKLTGQAGNNVTKNIEIIVPLKYLSNFWRTLEISLINCETTLDLNWSENYVTVAINVAAQATKFSITDTKIYVPVVTLSTRDQYLDFLIDPSFQGVNRLFVLPFEDEAQRTSYRRYYLPTREIKKYYNVMIDGQNFFYQPIRNDLITYDDIQKITTGQGDVYTTGSFQDYNYFKKYYKMIEIDLSKQQALEADPKALQELNITGNLEQQATISFITEEATKSFRFFTRNCKYSNFIVCFNIK